MFDPIRKNMDFNYGVGSDGATSIKADIRFRVDWITCMGLRMGVYLKLQPIDGWMEYHNI